MSQFEDRNRDSLLGSLTSAFRGRQDDRLEIGDYQVGDVRAEKPVVVAAGALLVGDLLAPDVIVSGIVYGYVACRRLIVAPKGQIWGDVYVNSLELAQSGKINGWVSTLDAGTVDLLRAREIGRGDLPNEGYRRLPDELLRRIKESGADVEADQYMSHRRSGIWRQLRSEAALALLARAEIEATFDQRLEEMLSSTPTKETSEVSTEAAEDESDVASASQESEQPSDDDARQTAQVERLRMQLHQATSAAQKYYGELLWTRAELRAARRGENDN